MQETARLSGNTRRIGAILAAVGAVAAAITLDRLPIVLIAVVVFEIATFVWAKAIDSQPDATLAADTEEPRRKLADRCRVVGVTVLAGLLLAGVILMSLTGSADLESIAGVLREKLAEQSASMQTNWSPFAGRTAAVCIFIAAAVLLGAAPVHHRVWDWFDLAPAWQATLWSSLSRALGLTIAWRLGAQTLAGLEAEALVISVALSLLTLGLALISLWQRDELQLLVVRLTTAQVGLIWLVIAASASESRESDQIFLGGVLLIGVAPAIVTLVVTSIAQWVAVGIEYVLRAERFQFLEELTGLGRSQPLAGGCLALALLSLTPLPPLPGFWSWFWVLGTAFVPGTPVSDQAGAVPNPAVLACMLFAIVVLLTASVRVIQVLGVMYWHEPLGRLSLASESWIFAATVVGALILLTCGLSPAVVVKLISLTG